MTHQGGPYPQAPTDPSIINLGLGQPSPALLPLEAIREAADAQLRDVDPLVLQYGARPGFASFREALAGFLTEHYGIPVAAQQLAVTGGTSLGLAIAATVFTRPGTAIACGDPTYFLARGILEDHHLKMLGIGVDDQGLDVDALERALEAGTRIDAVYCIPSFHNPLGITCLAPSRARKLVALAERHDFLIFADEPYTLLHFGPSPPPCMMSYDEGRGRVLSLGTFSKILGPGLRLGWVHAHPDLIERFTGHGTLRSGGGLNPVIAQIVEGTMASGFLSEHVVSLREALNSRAEALVRALRERIPGFDFTDPEGGYFVWGRLPRERDTTALLERSREHGMGFTPGARCAVSRDLSDCLRLSFSFYTEDELEEGVARLARALREGALSR